ncbi:MAG TPA: RHS repeat-associated core domain-containing protein [Thermoanaerobaculia bacterium]|jgi:RHS repeat-associated protein|nr:RHS repeat-associated core domain-containing protein [Thermoanaerobaculia bacterium]
MNSGWHNRLISQVLCCTLFLQVTPIAAGYLSASPGREWVSDERLADLVKPEPSVDVAVRPEPPEPPERQAAPEPVRQAALQQAEPRSPRIPTSILNDLREAAPAPAVPPRQESREEPRVEPPPLRPEDLPPFPPGMEGAILPQSSSAALKAVTSFSLLPGWNLGSVQNEPVDKTPASVFSSMAAKLTRVFAYDACTPGDPWKVYDPADATGSDLTQVDQKIGFWVEMTSPAAMPNPGTLADETAIHLCPGWNLIGFPAEQARPVRTALSSIEGKYTRVFGFDPADPADPWELYDVTVPSWANDLDLMQPGRGYWVLATAETDLTISNVGAEPDVALTAPSDLAVVTAPTEVRGTVTSDRLESWTLSYRSHGESESTVFATGTTPVVNGRLGTLDPTLLLNGGYAIELTATDFNGQIVTIGIDVSVEGQMKIGNFALAYQDLEVYASGLPIQILRTYDSRDRRQGDFGIGWRLELRQGSYRNNRKPGEGWQFAQGFLPCEHILETRGHITTIRLSDREVYRFKLALERGAPTLGGCFGRARFDFIDGPIPGATLTVLGNNEVIYQNGSNDVLDSGSFGVFEPRQVRLTLDGRVFDLDLQDGVTRVEDESGNELSLTSQEITHSSGRTVTFQRDARGRITGITDPDGESLAYIYDTAGNLVEVRDREEAATTFTYDARHLLLDFEDARGIKPIRNEYDETGRLVRHVDAFGKVTELTHDLAGKREVVTDREGRSRTLEFDDRGNVVRETDALGNVIHRTFDARGLLLSQTNPLDETTTYIYDANRNLTSVTDPLGHRTSYTYDARGRVLTTTDPRGKVTTNVYDAAGRLLSTTDPLGNARSFTYDAQGNASTETDAEGNTTTRAYDAAGNLISETDAEGTETTSTYDLNGRQLTRATTRTTASGTETLTWTYEYDANGRPTKSTNPDGSTLQTVYGPLGNVVETYDELGRKTSYRHDEMGRLLETAYPDGTKETSAYDPEGRRTSFTDRGGRTTTSSYDAVGRPAATTFPDGATVTGTFDVAGRLVAATDARNHTTRFDYDAAGRQTVIRDPLGNETVFDHDAAGNQIAIRDARNQTTSFEHDDAGRRTRITNPDGTFRTVGYDGFGRRTSETDEEGRTIRYAYDGLGRLTTVTDALDQVTRFAYDEQGNRISQRDAMGRTSRFEYDGLGRLIQRVLPGGAAESYTYDAAGNRLTRRDFKGAVTTYTYDPANRLLSRIYPDGTSIGFTYTASGRRATATDARGTTTYSYDTRDRLTTISFQDGRVLRLSYDLIGNRTSTVAEVAGQTLTTAYDYDELNRLQTVRDPLGRPYTHGYDANGNRTSLVHPNDVTTTYTYDGRNRLLGLSTATSVGAIVQSYLYTLGAAGTRERVDEHDGTRREYGYDSLLRLASETVSQGGAPIYRNTFTYDMVGNRTRQTRQTQVDSEATVAYTYDDRDRLLTEDSAAYGWDENGNLISKTGPEGATYVWDYENRLIRVELATGSVIEHSYDPDGNRIRTRITPATGPPTITDYLVDPRHRTSAGGPVPAVSQVVAETDATTGALVAYHVRGNDLLATLRPASGQAGWVSRFFHADALGSIRALTDESGNVTDRYAFEAFGTLLSHQGSDPNPYLFAGEPADPASGFSYLRARWLSSSLGLFASSDPLAGMSPGAVHDHLYAYAGGNPVHRVDPTGLAWFPALAGTFIHQQIRGMYPGPNLFGMIPDFPITLFPDIADLLTKEVIEIKPLSTYGLDGFLQLEGYILALNWVGQSSAFIGTGWHPGIWSPGPGPYVEPRTGTPYVVVGNVAGVLFYWVPPRKLQPVEVWERVKVRAKELNVDLQHGVRQVTTGLEAALDALVIGDYIRVSQRQVAAFGVAAMITLVGMVMLQATVARGLI